MSDYHDHQFDWQLEQYLDGMLTGDELADFERRLLDDAELRRLVEQQRDLDAELQARFTPNDTSASDVAQWLHGQPPTKKLGDKVRASKRSRRMLVLVGISVVVAIIAWTRFDNRGKIEAYFEQRPLVMLYRETVEQGFQPYYFCEDQERFAQTFSKRQSVPLRLNTLPDDRRMVGLSYLGGLSRNTTAMLAYVEDVPVVVFIDRAELDSSGVTTNPEDDLFVHRTELGRLVLYEVSPFPKPSMTPFLGRVD